MLVPAKDSAGGPELGLAESAEPQVRRAPSASELESVRTEAWSEESEARARTRLGLKVGIAVLLLGGVVLLWQTGVLRSLFYQLEAPKTGSVEARSAFYTASDLPGVKGVEGAPASYKLSEPGSRFFVAELSVPRHFFVPSAADYQAWVEEEKKTAKQDSEGPVPPRESLRVYDPSRFALIRGVRQRFPGKLVSRRGRSGEILGFRQRITRRLRTRKLPSRDAVELIFVAWMLDAKDCVSSLQVQFDSGTPAQVPKPQRQ